MVMGPLGLSLSLWKLTAFLLYYHGVADGSTPTTPRQDPYLLISSSVDTVVPAVTRDILIKCSFPAPSTARLASLVSLVLTKYDPVLGRPKELLSVNVVSGTEVHDRFLTNAASSSHLDPRMESFISLSWVYPDSDVSGYYECEATGLDASGHSHVFVSGRHIYSMVEDITVLTDIVRGLEIKLDNLTKQFSSQTQAVTSLFVSSNVVNNRRYYLSKFFFMDIAIAQGFCTSLGGYLAEINDPLEMAAVKQFLASQSQVLDKLPFILLGLQHQQGQWQFPSTGAAASYLNWHQGQPSTDTFHCAVVHQGSWDMFDYPCVARLSGHDAPTAFLCEQQVPV